MVRTKKVDGESFRKILVGLIVSDEFIDRFSEKFDSSMFSGIPFAEKICDWCLDFHERYDSAPKRHIQDLYDEQIKKKKVSKDELKLIEELLAGISGDFECSDDINPAFLLETAETASHLTDLTYLRDGLTEAIEKEDLRLAEQYLAERKEYEEPSPYTVINPFRDRKALRCVFDVKEEPLFYVRGGLGQLINPYLLKDNFINILAPEKRGKSHWLMEFAMCAAIGRRNVAFFQAGDMSESQFMTRIFMWMSGLPRNKFGLKLYPVPVLDCKLNQCDQCMRRQRRYRGSPVVDEKGKFLKKIPPDYVPCDYCFRKGREFEGAVWWKQYETKEFITEKVCAKWQKIFDFRTKGRDFKIATFPNSTLSVAYMDRMLKKWKKEEGFVPECVFADYPDIFAPEDDRKQGRDIQDERWRALRRLSQEHNCLLMTASQARRNAYTLSSISMEESSEDKRKNSHSTAQISINQTPGEKRRGIQRIGINFLRDGDCDEMLQAVVLQDLNTERVHLDSFLIQFSEKFLINYQ